MTKGRQVKPLELKVETKILEYGGWPRFGWSLSLVWNYCL